MTNTRRKRGTNMRQTVRVGEDDRNFDAIREAVIDATRPENLRITVRGKHNRKDGHIVPIERYGLNFYVTGSFPNATVYKGEYTQATVYKGKYTQEELDAAMKNTERAAIIGSMFDIVKGGGTPVDEWEFDGDPMLALTTTEQLNGAGVIFCDRVLQKIHEKMGDYYILPSSIHEVLIVPATCGLDRDKLKEMVCTVNRDQVAPEDQLSDEVYFYDGTFH